MAGSRASKGGRAAPRLARPLSADELRRGQEAQIVREIQEVLIGMAAALPAPSPAPRNTRSPWARIDEDPRHRLLFLDGPRGSGKTALLVTLIQQWSPTVGREVHELFAGTADKVRALSILDFEPLPPGLPLHAWLVEALHPMLQAAVPEPKGKPRAAKDWLDGGEEGDLSSQWEELRTAALVGWSAGSVLGGTRDGDLDAALRWASDQEAGWIGLRARWCRFLDALLERLESIKMLPPGGLVVLPIDDVDLEVRRVRELLLAVRLFRHPRLVFLLAGDYPHLQDMVRRAFYAELDLRDGALEPTVDALVREFLRKTIHPALTWKIPELPLAQVVTDNVLGLKDLFSGIPAGDANLAAILTGLGPGGALTFRQMEQLSDQCAAAEPRLLDVVELVMRAFEPASGVVQRMGSTLRVTRAGAVLKFVVSGPREFAAAGRARPRTARSVIYVLRGSEGVTEAVPPELALATELAARGVKDIAPYPVLPSPAEAPLLWSDWRGPGTGAVFRAGLPEPEPPSGLAAWVSAWREIADALPDTSPAEAVWWHWMRFAIARGYPGSAEGLPTPSAADEGRAAWKALLVAAWEVVDGVHTASMPAERDLAWRHWLRDLLRRLGGPEYGLPEARQMDILRSVLVQGRPPTSHLRFEGAGPGRAYTEALDAVQLARGGAARGGLGDFAADPRLLDDVTAAFPLSPLQVCRAVVEPQGFWPWIQVPTAAYGESPLLAMRLQKMRYAKTLRGRDRNLGALLHVRHADGPRWHTLTQEIGNVILAAENPSGLLREIGAVVDGRRATEAGPVMVDLWRLFARTLGGKAKVVGEVRIDRPGTGLVLTGLRGLHFVASRVAVGKGLPGITLARWDAWACEGGPTRLSGRWSQRPALCWLAALQSFAADQVPNTGVHITTEGSLLELNGVAVPHPDFPAWIDHELLSWHVFEKMLGELYERSGRGDDPEALKDWALLCFLDRCVELIMGDREYQPDRHPTYLPTFPANAGAFAQLAQDLEGIRGKPGLPPWVGAWITALAPLVERSVPPGDALKAWHKLIPE